MCLVRKIYFFNHDVPIHDDRHFKALYSFLRVKDFEGFKCAYHKLVEMGFDKRYIDKSLALCLAKIQFYPLRIVYALSHCYLLNYTLYSICFLFYTPVYKVACIGIT